MIQITPHMRILLAVGAVDFRRGIDGLVAICRMLLKSDPFSGTVFVFRNRKNTSIKVISYDGQGFWLCQKRLSKGRFQWWPKKSDQQIHSLVAHELLLLIWNGDPSKSNVRPAWKPIPNQYVGQG